MAKIIKGNLVIVDLKEMNNIAFEILSTFKTFKNDKAKKMPGSMYMSLAEPIKVKQDFSLNNKNSAAITMDWLMMFL